MSLPHHRQNWYRSRRTQDYVFIEHYKRRKSRIPALLILFLITSLIAIGWTIL